MNKVSNSEWVGKVTCVCCSASGSTHSKDDFHVLANLVLRMGVWQQILTALSSGSASCLSTYYILDGVLIWYGQTLIMQATHKVDSWDDGEIQQQLHCLGLEFWGAEKRPHYVSLGGLLSTEV